MWRVLMIAALIFGMSTAHASASDPFGIFETAGRIAASIEQEFACKAKGCLEKSVVVGRDSTVPERHRRLTTERYRAHADKQSMKAAAGIVAAYIGACEWDQLTCDGIYIEPHPADDSRIGRYAGPHGTRALHLSGFRDTEHQVAFLARMALIAERLGLEPNVGLGTVVSAQDITGFSYQMTLIGVNGDGTGRSCNEQCSCKECCKHHGKKHHGERHKGRKKHCSCKTTCRSGNNSRVWGYGYRTPQQILLQSKVRSGTIPEVFARYFLGLPSDGHLTIDGISTGIIMPVEARTTFYAPGAKSKVEGPFETSMPNVEGIVNDKGIPIPRTLDDVRLGRSAYVSIASDPTNYGTFLYLGVVTYQSPIDDKWYTGDARLAETDSAYAYVPALSNVFGYVNDTGSAFQGRADKFDVAVGNFSGWDGRKAEQFVDAQPYGKNVVHRWLIVRGLPSRS